jgi:hypothetical protein
VFGTEYLPSVATLSADLCEVDGEYVLEVQVACYILRFCLLFKVLMRQPISLQGPVQVLAAPA